MSDMILFENRKEILAERGINQATWLSLCSSIYPGAKPESVMMAIDYCAARGLDIMLKPVHLIPMKVSDPQTGGKVWRDVPLPGISLYRIQADRSGNYAGSDEPEFGPDVTIEGIDKYSKPYKVTYPEWCKYSVYKVVDSTRIVKFTAKEYWLENYATQASGVDCPNAMWSKRPYGQLAKCTEAQALRRGWPEIGATPTAEEMEGKHHEEDYESVVNRAKEVLGGSDSLQDRQPDFVQEVIPKTEDAAEKVGAGDELMSLIQSAENMQMLTSHVQKLQSYPECEYKSQLRNTYRAKKESLEGELQCQN